MNYEVEKLTRHCIELDNTADDHNNRLKIDGSRIQEIKARLEVTEESILDMKSDITMLETGKVDTATFRK